MFLSAHARNLTCNFNLKVQRFTVVHTVRLLHQLAGNHTLLSNDLLRDLPVNESGLLCNLTL